MSKYALVTNANNQTIKMIYNSQVMGVMDSATYRATKSYLKNYLSHEINQAGIPLEYHKYITESFPTFEIVFPNDSDSQACAKLALLFRLQKGMHDVNKIVLMAQRIEKFTREEAAYWLSKTLCGTDEHKKWAVKGLRIMLAGS